MIYFINLLYMLSPDGGQQLQFNMEFFNDMSCGYAIEALANAQEGSDNEYSGWSIHCHQTDTAWSVRPVARPDR